MASRQDDIEAKKLKTVNGEEEEDIGEEEENIDGEEDDIEGEEDDIEGEEDEGQCYDCSARNV